MIRAKIHHREEHLSDNSMIERPAIDHSRNLSGKKSPMPKPLKGLLFLFISVLGLLGTRLLPSVVSEGWIPTVTLVVALGLVTTALIEVVRTR
jgi:hypothetical protein